MTVKAIHLIVEDGGKKRTFKVTPGKLSIGRGVNAQLKLTDESIAEDYAELEILDDRGVLHVRQGARFPKIDGRSLRGDVPMDSDVTVSIGESKLTLSYEIEEVAKPAREKKTGDESADGESAVTPRTRQVLTEQKETKSSRRMLFANVGIALVVLVFLIYKVTASDEKTPEEIATSHLVKAREAANVKKWSDVEPQIAMLKPDLAARPEFKSQIAEIRKIVDDAHKEARVQADVFAGSDWLKVKLKDFDNNYLQGKVDEPAARVFMKRCRFFRDRWPTHPEMNWIDRNEERFKGSVDLSKPPTFADVQFEVKVLSYRIELPDYRAVFALFDEFQPHVAPADSPKLDQLIAEKRVDRENWFNERLDKARQEFQAGRKQQSFAMLVSVVIYAGDAEMMRNAAGRLQQFDDFDARMRVYRQDIPDEWAELMKEPSLSGWAAGQNLK